MSLNLAKIKERLNRPKNESGYEKIDYQKIYWKPKLGEQVIRVVPSKYNPEDTNKHVRYHQFNVFKRTIYSLKNWGEKDPVESLLADLYTENRDENVLPSEKLENEKLIYKLKPGNKYVIQVLVRGEEGLGVRLWEANATVREAIDKLTQDSDYGDITDIVNGTDLTVTGFKDTFKLGKGVREFVNVGITPKRKSSPLSTDPELVQKWLDEQNDPLGVHKKYNFEEIKDMLRKYISPDEAASEAEDDEDEVNEQPISKKYSKPKVEKKEVIEDEDDNEAPFTPDEDPIYKKFSGEKEESKSSGITKGVGKSTTSVKKKFADMFEDDDE